MVLLQRIIEGGLAGCVLQFHVCLVINQQPGYRNVAGKGGGSQSGASGVILQIHVGAAGHQQTNRRFVMVPDRLHQRCSPITLLSVNVRTAIQQSPHQTEIAISGGEVKS